MAKRIFVLFMVLAMVLSTACAKPEAPVPEAAAPATEELVEMESQVDTAVEEDTQDYGGTLLINEMTDYAPLGYPPAFPSATHSLVRLSSPALETLLRYDASGIPAPYLAESYEEDADALTMTIKLREGVLFHDGTKLDAEAVKWNLDAFVAAGSPGALDYSEIEIVDDLTLVIHLNNWSSTASGSLCTGGGLMVSPTAVQTNGEDWAKDNPVGTGPYKFVSRNRDVDIVYERFEDYWQGKPYLDGVKMIFTPDQTSRTLSFRNGDFDVLVRGTTANVLELASEGYSMYYTPSGTVPVTLLFASLDESSPLSNLKVRQAITHAVDVDALIDGVYKGAVNRTNQYAYPGHWGYDDSIELPEYNVELAKQLLAEAGYPDGFETTITHSVKAENADLACAAIQDMLGQIGIKVTINAIAAADVDVQLGAEGWEGIFYSWGAAQPDSAAAFKTYYANTKKYVSLIKPQEFLDAINNALVAKTTEEKIQYVHEAQRIVNEQVIAMPLYAPRDATVTQTDTHNTGFSQVMPATLWTPAEAWKDAE